MPGRFLFLALSAVFCSAKAQFFVQAGTKLATSTGADIVINSAGNVILGDSSFNISRAQVVIAVKSKSTLYHNHLDKNGRNLILIDSLRMDGGDGNLLGNWVVKKGITLKSGLLTVDSISPLNFGRLDYNGADLGDAGNDNSYINGPMFITGASTTRTFPIGNSNGYFPARLIGVTDATALTRIQCVATSSPPITLADLTTQFPDIDDLVADRYYDFNVFKATSFSGSLIELSLNNQSVIDPSKNKPVVVERDRLGTVSDLEGSISGKFAQSGSITSAKGGKYMIAASKDVAIKIHKLITPNSDGENDVLVIEGIDLYPVNKVTLLDRWGGVYLTKSGFASGQTDIDYTKLVNGNYICIVEYTDSKGTHKPKPQMITVLK